MSMQPPGSKSLNISQLKNFYDNCRACFGHGWIKVAYDYQDNNYLIFNFPCRCTFNGGLFLEECISTYRYNRQPDNLSPKLTNNIFIHPRLSTENFYQLKESISKHYENHPTT